MLLERTPGRTTAGSAWSAINDLWQAVGAGTRTGLVAGVITGFAARLAMRISGLAAGKAAGESFTEAGFEVGDITLGGSIFLCLFCGFFGIYGGLAYFAIRPSLPGSGRASGLVVGLLLLMMLGPLVIEAVNPDFHLFGPPLLNISTFAAVLLLFGVLVVPIAARFARLPSKPLSRFRSVGRVASSILGTLTVVAMFRLLLVGLGNRLAIIDVPPARSIAAEMISAGFNSFRYKEVRLADDQITAILLLLWVLLFFPAFHWLVGSGRMSIVTGGRQEPTRRATILGSVFLGVPCLFGVILLVRAGVVFVMTAC